MQKFTPPDRLVTEALVIAVVFAIVFGCVHVMAMQILSDEAMTNHFALVAQGALAAAVFHIAFEYSGLNGWYCRERNKLLHGDSCNCKNCKMV